MAIWALFQGHLDIILWSSWYRLRVTGVSVFKVTWVSFWGHLGIMPRSSWVTSTHRWVIFWSWGGHFEIIGGSFRDYPGFIIKTDFKVIGESFWDHLGSFLDHPRTILRSSGAICISTKSRSTTNRQFCWCYVECNGRFWRICLCILAAAY